MAPGLVRLSVSRFYEATRPRQDLSLSNGAAYLVVISKDK